MADKNDPCFISVRTLVPSETTDQEILDGIDVADAQIANTKNRQDFKRLAQSEQAAMEKEFAKKKLSLIQNAIKEVQIRQRIASPEFNGNITKFLTSALFDMNKNNYNSLFSTNIKVLWGALAEMDKNGGSLWEVAKKPENMLPIIKQSWAGPERLPDITEDVYKIATAITKKNNVSRQMVVDSGVTVGFIDKYFSRQIHNPERIREFPKSEWVKDMMRLTSERTMLDLKPEDRVKEFERGYDRITSEDFDEMDDLPQVGAKYTGSRSYLFNSPEALDEYYQKYGDANVASAILRDIKSTARFAARNELFGSEHKKLVSKLFKEAQEQIKEKGGDPLAEFELFSARRKWDYALGRSDGVARGLTAAAKNTIMNATVLNGLHSVAITSFTDIGTSGFISRAMFGRGLRPVQDIAHAFHLFLTGLSKEHAKVYAERMHVFADGLQQDLMREVFTDGESPGMFYKTMKRFGALSLASAQHRGSKISSGGRNARVLYDLRNTEFENLAKYDGRLPNIFKRYGISKRHWDIIRTSIEPMPLLGGGSYDVITPEAVLDSGNSKLHQEAARRLTMMLVDASERGTPSNSIVSDTFRTLGVPKESQSKDGVVAFGQDAALGVWQLWMQFKGFMVENTLTTKTISKLNKEANGTKGQFVELGMFLAAMMTLSYLSASMKDFLTKGMKPQSLVDDDGEINWSLLLSTAGGAIGLGLAADSLFALLKDALKEGETPKDHKELQILEGMFKGPNFSDYGTVTKMARDGAALVTAVVDAARTEEAIPITLAQFGKFTYNTLLQDPATQKAAAKIFENVVKDTGVVGLNVFWMKLGLEFGFLRYLHQLGDPRAPIKQIKRDYSEPRLWDDSSPYVDFPYVGEIGDPTETLQE